MSGVLLTVTVDNRVEELARIYEALDQFADRSQLPQPTRRALLLIVEELFTNVVSYGYEPGAADTIVLVMRRDGEDVALTIRDGGRPFDVGQVPAHPQGDPTLDEMPVGGLGLILVHEFARSVTSRRDGATNVTEIHLLAGSDAEAVPPA